jgi:hypothetical protein
MLAEHDRCGPALAATPDTFPLNDVDYLRTRAIPDGPARAAKLGTFRIPRTAQRQLEPQGKP